MAGKLITTDTLTATTINNSNNAITGSVATDFPALGNEFLIATGWTSTGWTGDFATGFTHTTGNTSSLSSGKAAVIGTAYYVYYTVTNCTAGFFNSNFAGSAVQLNITSSRGFGWIATTTRFIEIAPTTDFNGTVVVSIKPMTASSAITTFNSSDGTARNEIRTGGKNLDNVFIGMRAGSLNTTGTYNIGIGSDALAKNMQGLQNICIGQNALSSNVDGSYLIGIGPFCLSSNTTGKSNIAIGTTALRYNTTGTYNVAYGPTALEDNIIGDNNNAFGYFALGNSTSSNNTAFGSQALQGQTTGANNTALGYYAGRYVLLC